MNYTILNREYQPAADGFCHLAPFGDFPGIMRQAGEDVDVIQRFDREAFRAIVANFKPKVLVDFEHRSMLPAGDTTAAAWITSLQERADGLWAALEFSDVGATAVKNKRIRFLSPAFDVEMIDEGKKIVRPMQLISVGLTNRPNLKTLQPLSNKAADGTTVENDLAAKAGKVGKMKGIIALLGLPEASDEAAVLDAIRKLLAAKTDLTTANAKVKELEGAVLNTEADAFVVANAAKIKDAPSVKKQFVANKEATIALFAAVADVPAAKTAVVHNRAGAKTPEGGGTIVNKATEQEVLVQQVRNREKCGYKAAFNMARQEKPELFKEEAKED